MTDRERIIQEQMTAFGVDRPTAEFIAALELGEVDGDTPIIETPIDDEERDSST